MILITSSSLIPLKELVSYIGMANSSLHSSSPAMTLTVGVKSVL